MTPKIFLNSKFSLANLFLLCYNFFMIKIEFPIEYFNINDTLTCGQFFRYKPFDKGFLVFSLDKCAYCYQTDDKTIIECENADKGYFYNFFDLFRDYSLICNSAKSFGVEILTTACKLGKGIRILNQDKIETLFTFIISQNNNIPRIKKSIEKICTHLGEKKTFLSQEYFAFPKIEKLASAPLDFYKSAGLGYRAEYFSHLANSILNGYDLTDFENLTTADLKKELVKIRGVGPKVADCVSLFGYHRADSFPVDTWIEKVYREDFNGKEKDRNKITEYLLQRFGENAGYFQQYLFHYKRLNSKPNKK